MGHRQAWREKKCPHRRKRRGMRVFLRPSLLLMLLEGEAHGYNLYDQLPTYGFNCDRLDSSLVYRHLRDMEDLGLIESHWDEDSMGPRRRVYRILPAGMKCLADWMDELGDIRDQVSDLLRVYQLQIREVEGPGPEKGDG